MCLASARRPAPRRGTGPANPNELAWKTEGFSRVFAFSEKGGRICTNFGQFGQNSERTHLYNDVWSNFAFFQIVVRDPTKPKYEKLEKYRHFPHISESAQKVFLQVVLKKL